MDYEVEWRSENDFARRMRTLAEGHGADKLERYTFVWDLRSRSALLHARFYDANAAYVWLCEVKTRSLPKDQKRLYINFARAKYEL